MALSRPTALDGIYGVVLAAGGVLGYATTQSTASLVMGLVDGVLVSCAGRSIKTVWSALVAIVMGRHWANGAKLLPTGILTVVAAAMTLVNARLLVRGPGLPPRVKEQQAALLSKVEKWKQLDAERQLAEAAAKRDAAAAEPAPSASFDGVSQVPPDPVFFVSQQYKECTAELKMRAANPLARRAPFPCEADRAAGWLQEPRGGGVPHERRQALRARRGQEGRDRRHRQARRQRIQRSAHTVIPSGLILSPMSS